MYEIDRNQFIEKIDFPINCKCISCPQGCTACIHEKKITFHSNNDACDIPLLGCILESASSDNFIKISLVEEKFPNKYMCDKKRKSVFLKIDRNVKDVAPALYWKMFNKISAYRDETAIRDAEINKKSYQKAMEYLFKREVEKKNIKPSRIDRFKGRV